MDGPHSLRRPHLYPAARPPTSAPNGIEPTAETVHFDPAVHLQLEPPAFVKMLSPPDPKQTDCVCYPVPLSESEEPGCMSMARSHTTGEPVQFTGLAYTSPFRVLSDEGVRAFRQVVDDNEKFAGCVPSLVPKCIRGLGYRSKFVHDLNYCEQLLEHLGHCAGIALGPHGMSMNHSQINFGEVGGGPVNQWHMDSVPYVMVILLSDATDMEGGELLVARLGDPYKALEMIRNETIDPKLIDKVNYPGPGYAIFMQGSQIAHAVTPVVRAKEKRLTCINSYQSLNPFSQDYTVYKTFTTMDGDAPQYEFARNVAWRVQGQLDYLLNKVQNGQQGHADVEAILERAAAELQRARDLVTNRIEDQRPYDTDGKAAAVADAAIMEYGTGVFDEASLIHKAKRSKP
jgi:hypothetical protein